jgi:hypothetical protein
LFLVTGDSAVPWREFYGLLRTLNGDATVHYGVDFVREWFCYPNKYLGEVGQRLDLYELVESFQNRGATDPRDKIFGFFGLWNSKEVENNAAEVITQQGSSTTPTTKANILIPDYAKSVERVYIDFTIWNIQTTGDLTVLKNCCAQRALESNAIDIHVLGNGLVAEIQQRWLWLAELQFLMGRTTSLQDCTGYKKPS